MQWCAGPTSERSRERVRSGSADERVREADGVRELVDVGEDVEDAREEAVELSPGADDGLAEGGLPNTYCLW